MTIKLKQYISFYIGDLDDILASKRSLVNNLDRIRLSSWRINRHHDLCVGQQLNHGPCLESTHS